MVGCGRAGEDRRSRLSVPIRLSGVTKSYGKARGVVDLDLEVRPGEVFGYLGPNGAGKTTTIRMLVDLIRPQSGRVEVLGGSPSDPAIRRRIGYLPGEVKLYERLSGRDLLTYVGNLRGDGGSALAAPAGRAESISTCPAGSATLSKGNRQKLALVQSLMHRPELVILDEPTSGFDPLVQQEVLGLLEEINTEGVTIFFSSHVLSEVERMAQRVGIIREGRLVEVEELEALRLRAVRTFRDRLRGHSRRHPIREVARSAFRRPARPRAPLPGDRQHRRTGQGGGRIQGAEPGQSRRGPGSSVPGLLPRRGELNMLSNVTLKTLRDRRRSLVLVGGGHLRVPGGNRSDLSHRAR